MKTNTETSLVPYDLDTAIVERLKTKYMDIVIPPGDTNALEMVKGGQSECRKIRLACDEWHKDRKADILKAGRHYDAEKNRVHALLEPIESHLKAVRKKEDDRLEEIRQEKIRQEEERVAKIRAKIENMKAIPSRITPLTTLSEIKEVYQALLDWEAVSEKNYNEFVHEAMAVYNDTLSAVEKIKGAREQWETEQAAAKAESERLEKIRQEQEAEANRLADLRNAEEEKNRIERESIEAEKQKIKDQLDKIEREKREAEIREKARKDALKEAEDKAEKEKKEQIEKEKREAADAEKKRIKAEKEKARKEALKPDKKKLIEYATFLQTIIPPEIKDEEVKGYVRIATFEVYEIGDRLLEKAKEL